MRKWVVRSRLFLLLLHQSGVTALNDKSIVEEISKARQLLSSYAVTTARSFTDQALALGCFMEW